MQVCVSVMRASTIDRDWKLTKRTAREREKERERASGQRGKRRARQLTFSVLFCSYSSPFVRFPQVLSHDDSVCRFLKPSWLQMDDFSRCRNSVLCHLQECLFIKTHRQTHTLQCLWFYDLLCARARVCVLILHGVPLLLCCLLHSTGTPTLSRYIVDIRPLTSPILSFTTSLVRRGVALKPAGSGCVVLRKCATELGESHYSDFLAQIPPLGFLDFLTPSLAHHAFSWSSLPPLVNAAGKLRLMMTQGIFFACENN